jgi:single-strand DNA-binding protein
MNVVILSGQLSSDPRCTELPTGELRWSLDLTTSLVEGNCTVPVSWHGTLPSDQWCAGSVLCVVGHARRRFFRVGGITQSRTEVLAQSIIQVGPRSSPTVALRRAMRVLDSDVVTRLRSMLPALE